MFSSAAPGGVRTPGSGHRRGGAVGGGRGGGVARPRTRGD
eukprot:ctg_5233.g648